MPPSETTYCFGLVRCAQLEEVKKVHAEESPITYFGETLLERTCGHYRIFRYGVRRAPRIERVSMAREWR